MTPSAEAASVILNGRAVRVAWSDGFSARYHAVWLRYNALDEATRSASNGQRLISLLDVPSKTAATAAAISPEGEVSITLAPDMRAFRFPAEWLRARAYDQAREAERGWFDPAITTWDAGFGADLPRSDWRAVSTSPAALAAWLVPVRAYGFSLLENVPKEPGAVCTAAERFGFVRETNYGRLFDVRAQVNPSNLAFTNLGLEAHSDNPYRDPVPTLQLLCCLENSVEGGDSRLVDGFRAVERLKSENLAHFDLLSGYCTRFEYAGSPGVRLRSRRPVIELAPDGQVIAVRWNNRSAAAPVDVPFDEMEGYYAASRRFTEIIEDPAMWVTFKLAPGELFMVDNTRVLHAREAYSGEGSRWLQGCYADKDGLLSTLAAIEDQVA